VRGERGTRSREDSHETTHPVGAAVDVRRWEAGLLLSHAPPALGQGPYGRNSYADFPSTRVSLFLQTVKPSQAQPARDLRPPVPGGYRGYTYPKGATRTLTPAEEPKHRSKGLRLIPCESPELWASRTRSFLAPPAPQAQAPDRPRNRPSSKMVGKALSLPSRAPAQQGRLKPTADELFGSGPPLPSRTATTPSTTSHFLKGTPSSSRI